MTNEYKIKIEVYDTCNPRIIGNEIWVDIIPQWISVLERLPEDFQEILMTCNDLVIKGMFVNGKFFYPYCCAHCTNEEQEGITHWMPLPSPP